MNAEDLAQWLSSHSARSISELVRAIHREAAPDWQAWVDELGLEQETINVAGELYLVRYFLSPAYKTHGNARTLIHHFIRGDYDRRPHNHPWNWADAVILSGGYTEARVIGFTDGEILMDSPEYRTGDVNKLTGMDFHRVHSVLPNTWTVFSHGPVVKKWGFIEGAPAMINYEDYTGPDTSFKT